MCISIVKTVLFSAAIFLLSFGACSAVEQDGGFVGDAQKSEEASEYSRYLEKNERLEGDIIKLDETISGDGTTPGEIRHSDDLTFKGFLSETFNKQKKIVFKDSFLDEISGELRYRSSLDFERSNSDKKLHTTYPFTINTAFEAKFEKDYRIFGEYAFARPVNDLEHKFWGKFSNLYIEKYLTPKHLVRVGTARAPIGLEGAMSTFSLPFSRRAQISRNYGDATATGVWFLGEKGAFDYNIGAYTSTRRNQGFKDGAEFIGRVGVKPFYNQEGSYFRNLKLYAGTDLGHRGKNYGVYTTALTYEYKKFLFNFEYAYADGSNSDYLDSRRGEGFFTTIGWNFTPKFQVLGRYDYFDPNKNETGDVNHEYSLGLNYFVYKQRLKVMLNYVFSVNEKTDANQNAIFLVTQFFI